MQYEFLHGGETYTVSLDRKGDLFEATIGGRRYTVDARRGSDQLLSFIVDGRSVLAHVVRGRSGWALGLGGKQFVLEDPAAAAEGARGGAAAGGDGRIATPMPGKVVEVLVQEGDAVEAGQALLILESMKMQNDIKADISGVVKKVHFKAGDVASFGDPLVEIEAASG